MRLTTKRLIIREISRKDASDIIRNVNDLRVSRYLLVVPYPYKRKNAEEWISSCIKDSKKKKRTDYSLAIELKNEKRLVGVISIMHLNKFQGIAEIGFWLGKEYWRQGIMSEAIAAILKFSFEKLKLRRIDWNAFAENRVSNILAKKFGFINEGIRRKSMRAKSNGKIHDANLYGLLREEWKKRAN